MDAPREPPPAPPAPQPAPPARARARRPWGITAALVLLLAAALAAGTAWLVATEPGLRALAAWVERLAPVPIELQGAHGTLVRGFGFAHLRLAVQGTEVEIADLRAQPDAIDARPLRLALRSLTASRVSVRMPASASTAAPPASIAAPLAVAVARLAIGELEIAVGDQRLRARALTATLAIGPDGYRVGSGQAEVGGQPLSFEGRLDGAPPFALAWRGSVRSALREHALQAQWRAEGSLAQIGLAVELASGETRGTLDARLDAFATPVLKSLHADFNAIDLRAWQPGAPRTRLALRTDLVPDPGGSALDGPVRIVNDLPGTLDAQRLPLRAAQGEIHLSRDTLQASRLVVQLTRGSLRGGASARLGGAIDWRADLALTGVDPATIHSRAQSLTIDGHARVHASGRTTSVQAQLRNRGERVVDARLDLRVEPRRIDIAHALLTLGAGRLALGGSIDLAGDRRVRLAGTVERFEPGLLVRGLDARVSGSVEVDARLDPRPAGELRFTLADSRAFGRPLAGHGRLSLDAAQRLDVDLELALRSARIAAHGGLGAPGRRLAVSLDAPAIDELLPALHGSVKLDVSASGAWNAPAFEARLGARDLRWGEQRLHTLDVTARYGGGSDGRLALRIQVAQHLWQGHEAWSVRSAALDLEGTRDAHRLTLQGVSAGGYDFALALDGGLDAGLTWRGMVREARLAGPGQVRLLGPAALVAASGRIDFGPARWSAFGAQFDGVRFARDSRGLRTAGRFAGLRVQGLLTGDGEPPAGAQPLALRGAWTLDLGTQADGSLHIEREGGDLYAGNAAGSALRVGELALDATLQADRLSARARASSERGGSASAALTALVERDASAGWRLAQHQPWQLDAQADLSSLARVQALFGERLGSAVAIDGRLTARVALTGTPGDVRASGTLDGSALQLAWIDQGMRLDHGVLHAHLIGDSLQLDELSFAATPRVQPAERRAAQHIDFAQPGTLDATGRLRLADAAGTIRVVARRLPLLQRPDRWVVASGEATIQTSLERAQVDGRITVDAGYAAASSAELPTLSSDVVVSRTGAQAPRAPRFTLGVDLGIDLGPSFWVKGAGLQARAEGRLRLRSAGRGAIAVTGTIEGKEGRYDGFGQHLALERARVNFQGSPDNPELDILAVRQGLPVEVGVTVTRDVAHPLVRLYSDPPMADQEALSWLLFGHAGEQTRADNLALLQAAASALSGSELGVAGQLAKALGIDELTLRSGALGSAGSLLPQTSVAGNLRGDSSTVPALNTEIVSIGKRLSERITLSYEQALAGTESVVQITYRLSQRLSFVARAGTDNAFDLVYTWTFD